MLLRISYLFYKISCTAAQNLTLASVALRSRLFYTLIEIITSYNYVNNRLKFRLTYPHTSFYNINTFLSLSKTLVFLSISVSKFPVEYANLWLIEGLVVNKSLIELLYMLQYFLFCDSYKQANFLSFWSKRPVLYIYTKLNVVLTVNFQPYVVYFGIQYLGTLNFIIIFRVLYILCVLYRNIVLMLDCLSNTELLVCTLHRHETHFWWPK